MLLNPLGDIYAYILNPRIGHCASLEQVILPSRFLSDMYMLTILDLPRLHLVKLTFSLVIYIWLR